MKSVQNLSRRGFLSGALAGAGGLVLGARLGATSMLAQLSSEGEGWALAEFAPNLFLKIDTEGLVTIVAHRSEMGTGIRTALPMVVADELDAELDRVQIEQAVGDRRLGSQNTDGSKSIRDFYQPMREAGASARAMLVAAAAAQLGVPASELTVKQHAVHHAAKDVSIGFGKLVEAAAKLEVPEVSTLTFKSPDQWRYVGKDHSITDARDLADGTAKFGADVRPEGMVFAMIARSPVLGGTAKSFDADAAKAVPGVLDVVSLDGASAPFAFKALGGVAVIAKNTWAAKKGREALNVQWDAGSNESYGSTSYREALEAAVSKPGKAAAARGDAAGAMESAKATHAATYYAPHLAHATMEPPCAVAVVKDGKCELWAPVQNPQAAQQTVAGALGIKPGDVTCNVTLLGGGFGRKSKPDFCAEAALLSRELGKPVRVQWTREDDIRHDYYHSVAAVRLEAGLDAEGKPSSWLGRTAFPSINSTFNPAAKMGSGFELGLGFTDIPYDIPNVKIEVGAADAHVRIGWLRSVSNIYHAFAVHSFVDELATMAKADPLKYVLDLIGEDREIDFEGMGYGNYGQPLDRFPADTGKLKAVARLCAEKAGWGKELPKGRAQGFAVHRSFLSYVATVVEVEVSKAGEVTIPRVDIAIDCGLVVSPDRVRAQMEGSVVFGQSLAMFGEITAKDGAIEQSNFHDYRMTRMNEAPREIHVHLMPSDALPAGVGEPGVPPVASAICNAIAAATGKRVRDLPISKHDLSWG